MTAIAATTYCPPTEVVSECPLCSRRRAEFLFATIDRLYRLPGEFGLVRCQDCSLVRLSPRPLIGELGFYYPEAEYYSYQDPVTEAQAHAPGWRGRLKDALRDSVLAAKGYEVARLAAWQRALQPLIRQAFGHRVPYGYGERFPDYKPCGRALEIGCGSGTFLGLLKHHGWQVAGVELSARAAAAAKEKLGVDVFVGPLEAAGFAADSFDYIHMSHVIEHLPDPVQSLREVRRLLKPGGEVYIETPNIDSLDYRQSGRYWFPLDTPRHLFLFAPTTLRRAVSEAGLQVHRLCTGVANYYDLAELYRREERESRAPGYRLMTHERPPLAFSARLRCQWLALSARLNYLRQPQAGSILYCRATKA